MKNNKGFTLVELMIGVSLVSVIMIFTLNLLNDLRTEEDLGSNKTIDLTNRTIIAKRINDDFYKKEVVKIAGTDGTTDASNNKEYQYCPIKRKAFGDRYNFYVDSCFLVYYGDHTCGVLATGSRIQSLDKVNLFMYATKVYTDEKQCLSPDGGDFQTEIWELQSATYVMSDKSGEEDGPRAYFSQFTQSEQPNADPNKKDFFFMVKFPTEMPEAYSNTSMNFDLEFSYYTGNSNVLNVKYSDGSGTSNQATMPYLDQATLTKKGFIIRPIKMTDDETNKLCEEAARFHGEDSCERLVNATGVRVGTGTYIYRPGHHGS